MGTRHFTKEHKEKLRLAQPHRIIPPQKDLLVNLYLEQRKSTREIANQLGRNQRRIMSWLKLYSIPRRTYKENKMPVKKGGTHNWGYKISESVKGKRNGSWAGGLSPAQYPRVFNKRLKEEIRKRDNYTCQKCGMTEKESLEKWNRVLSVNHIDFDKNNCNPNNLNTLCVSCNTIVNSNRSYWKKIFQAKLNKIYG